MKPLAYVYTCRNPGQVALLWAHQPVPFGHGWIDVKAEPLVRLSDTFTPVELNNFRQWFNAISDTNPNFIDQTDRDLYAKLTEMLK